MTSRIEFTTRGVKIMAIKKTRQYRKKMSEDIARNASTKSQRGSTKRVQQRKKTTTARVAKKTTPRKTTPKKSNIKNIAKKAAGKTRLGKAIGLGTLLTTGAMSMMKKKDPTFGEAFNKARKDLGPNAVFPYKGKKYSTVTKDQVKKAGYNTLREYLNAGGKKKTSVKKPMKRKTGPRNRR
jgi:hypothetical protein